MNKCFLEWKISDKIKVGVSDNTANITAAINLNKQWHHLPCLVHSINLIAKSGSDEIKDVYKKVKSIVEFFKRSPQASIKLRNAQDQMDGYKTLKLIQDVSTRWNSTFDMFQRILDTKEPLISTIAILGNVENLTHAAFELIEHYCSIFKPFKEITVELGSEKGVSISSLNIS